MNLIDTHCHIHDSEFASRFDKSQGEILNDARDEGVVGFVCVGTDVRSSREAILFVAERADCYASVALHPHESEKKEIDVLKQETAELDKLLADNKGGVVAVGECGLDYYYHSSKEVRDRQKYVLLEHIQLAIKYQLPLIFHIRDPKDQNDLALGEAFSDFFAIFDEYENLRGVIHSFSAGPLELESAIKRGLYVGLNGIMTFSKQTTQLESAKMVPLQNLVLETDAPFLTPVPFRGTMCEPKHVSITAKFLSELRDENLDELAKATTHNAKLLFGIR